MTFLRKRNVHTYLLGGILLSCSIVACKKKEPVDANGPTYNVPATYDFANVDYTGQTQRLDMLDEISAYIKTANTQNTALDLAKVKGMYANTGDYFTGAGLNTSGKQLKDKTILSEVAVLEGHMEALVQASQSTVAGSNGQAGVVTSNDQTKKYLFDANGIEHIQLVEKGIMGAVLYFQAVAVYLSDAKIGDQIDNTIVKEGKGTDMEHHWDEAFGYLGVPKDFPANQTGIRYWAKYIVARDSKLGCNEKIMNAFIKGRAAISNKDMATKNQCVAIIREEWEKAAAATAISYLNGAKRDFADDSKRNHQLSEAYAFVQSLKYSPTRKITQDQINQVLAHLGTNYYEISTANMDAARDQLSTIYGFDEIKTTL